MQTMFNKVQEFQTAVLGKQFPEKPVMLASEKMDDLRGRIIEELDEMAVSECHGNLPEVADALIDMIYFALGGLHQMGIDADRVFDDVHAANMRKVAGKTKRNQEDDAAKPEDWAPPTHSWILGEME
jgi:predicted HAD superfamily Cof-like phosphohydrolase